MTKSETNPNGEIRKTGWEPREAIVATLEYHSPKRIQTRWWLVAVMFLIFVGCLVLILGVTDVAPNPPIPSKPLTGK